VSVTLGAAPNAVAKVIVASLPPEAHPVPVVTVMRPDVSVPETDTVGLVHAAVPAEIPGVVPPLMRCPLTVRFSVTSSDLTVTVIVLVLAVNSAVALVFCINSAVAELTLIVLFEPL